MSLIYYKKYNPVSYKIKIERMENFMSNWLISSIQQYTIDRLRVSFSIDYSVNEFSKLSCKLYDQNMIDVTDKLCSIT